MPKGIHSAQKRFNDTYITSIEICKRLNVPRSAVFHARRRGELPTPITMEGIQLHIWERKEVEPLLKDWADSLRVRRGDVA